MIRIIAIFSIKLALWYASRGEYLSAEWLSRNVHGKR